MIIICPNCSKRYKIADESLGGGRKVRCANCQHRWYAEPPKDDDSDAEQPAAPSETPPAAPAEPKRKKAEDKTAKSASDAKSDIDESDDSADDDLEQSDALDRAIDELGAELEGTAGDVDEAVEDIADAADEKPAKIIKKTPKLRKQKGGSKIGMVGWLLALLVIIGLVGLVVGRNEVVAMFPKSADYFRMVGLPVTMDIGLEISETVSKRDNSGEIPAIVIEGQIQNISDAERAVPTLRVALLDANREEIDFGLFDPPQTSLLAGAMMKFDVRLIDPPAAARNYHVTFEQDPG